MNSSSAPAVSPHVLNPSTSNASVGDPAVVRRSSMVTCGSWPSFTVAAGIFATLILGSANASAQQGYPSGSGQAGWSTSGQSGWNVPSSGYGYAPQQAPPRDRSRETWEIGTLYGASLLYGVGMGVWVSTELDFNDDPGVFAIAPAVLGIAAPAGVFFLDQPKMQKGLPMATTTGMVFGAGNGVGLVLYQHAKEPEADAWGFEELTRATAITTTIGAVGGYAGGYFMEPPPASGLLVTSGVFWGAGIGAMFGYGASAEDKDYNTANESAALGGWIGLNAGAVLTGALTAAYVPSVGQIGWMWAGAGVGAAVSLPIYLLYIGDDKPPAKRGLLFSGTTTTLGIIAGALLGSGADTPLDSARDNTRDEDPALAKLGSWGALYGFGPLATDGGGLGLQAQGVLY